MNWNIWHWGCFKTVSNILVFVPHRWAINVSVQSGSNYFSKLRSLNKLYSTGKIITPYNFLQNPTLFELSLQAGQTCFSVQALGKLLVAPPRAFLEQQRGKALPAQPQICCAWSSEVVSQKSRAVTFESLSEERVFEAPWYNDPWQLWEFKVNWQRYKKIKDFSATEQNREISQLCLIEFSSVLNQSLQRLI